MEDIVPGYNDAKKSLMEKLEEPIEMYLLTKLKIAQFRSREPRQPAIEQELKGNMATHVRRIDEVLLKDINGE